MSSFSDVEHFATMVAGCESINAGKPNSEEGRYARSVLRLYTPDFGAVAGQEGFLENVKAGAQKTGEFIKKLYEAIKKWFADTFRTTKGKLASIFKSGDDEKKKAMREKLRSACTPKIEALKTAVGSLPEGVKAEGFADKADKAIASMAEGKTPTDVMTGMNALLDAVTKVSSDFESHCAKALPRKSGESHAPYEKAVKAYKAWAEKAQALTNAITQVYSYKSEAAAK